MKGTMLRRGAIGLVLAVVFAAGMLAAIRPDVARSHSGGSEITCQAVTFSYVDFKSGVTNTVHETIVVDGSSVYDAGFSFAGSSGGHTVGLSLGFGEHVITASANWNTNGHSGSFRSYAKVDCGDDTTTTTEPPTTTTVTEPPPRCPGRPGGMPPEPPGGKDGNPGNDECVPDEPAVTTTTTTPPTTTTTTTTTESQPTTTETTPPPVSSTPEPPSSSPPKVTTPTTPKVTRPKKPKGTPPDAPPVCRPGQVETEACGVQGSG